MSISGAILVIDDESALRQSLARILQRAGHQVTTAENAEQGMAFIEAGGYDLVFMDLRMPGMAGMEALKLIHDRYPDLPVVLFTAQPDLSSAVEALRSGATDYLLKPLKPEAILERAEKIISDRRREERKAEILRQIEALQAELKSLSAGEPGPSPLPRVESERFLRRGALVLDLHKRSLLVNGQSATLPPTPFEYLLVLARHAPEAVSYQTLVAEAQGYQADLREAQELAKWHIHALREALEKNGLSNAMVVNVRGEGYRLVAD